MIFPPELFQILPGLLLPWFEREKRTLQWRSDPTPYHVWVSEIMLQQTRVEFVKEYYSRFIGILPDVRALADAPDDLLLKLWEGLGYYSRVRNLKRAAQIIMEKHHGKIPDDYDSIRALPGIGDYTAGAVLSIAFGQPCPAVDGNVLRVCTRFSGCNADIGKPEVKRDLTETLRRVYPAGQCSAFTQSLMELGALICLPNGAPDCLLCPLRVVCIACRDGLTDRIPVKAPKKVRTVEKRIILMVRRAEKIALHRRPGKGLLAGLLEFPGVETSFTERERKRLFGEHAVFRKGPDAVHIFTHIEWHMKSFYVDLPDDFPDDDMPFDPVWTTSEELITTAALPSAFRVFRNALSKTGTVL